MRFPLPNPRPSMSAVRYADLYWAAHMELRRQQRWRWQRYALCVIVVNAFLLWEIWR